MALNYTMSGSLQPLGQQAFGLLEFRNSDQEGQEPFSHPVTWELFLNAITTH
jgi:hypothetical protein